MPVTRPRLSERIRQSWLKFRKSRYFVVLIIFLVYFVIYSFANPSYPRNLALKVKSFFNKQKAVIVENPIINIRKDKDEALTGYFESLAAEVAGSTAEVRLSQAGDGSIDVVLSVGPQGQRPNFDSAVRYWVHTFLTEAYLSPYNIRSAAVEIYPATDRGRKISVYLGKNQVLSEERERLRLMTADDFCRWLKANETGSDNSPADATYSVNFNCSG